MKHCYSRLFSIGSIFCLAGKAVNNTGKCIANTNTNTNTNTSPQKFIGNANTNTIV